MFALLTTLLLTAAATSPLDPSTLESPRDNQQGELAPAPRNLGLRFTSCDDRGLHGMRIDYIVRHQNVQRAPVVAYTDVEGVAVTALTVQNMDIVIVRMHTASDDAVYRRAYQFSGSANRYDEWVLVDIEPGGPPSRELCEDRRGDGEPIHFQVRLPEQP